MKRSLMTVTLLVMGATLATGTTLAQERSYSLLDREIEYLMAVWPGNYDNVEQTSFDQIAGKDRDSGAHLRIHTHVQKVDLPEFGDYVLDFRAYLDSDLTNAHLHDVYALSADDEHDAVRVRRFTVADEKEQAADLTMADVTERAGCDLLIRRDSDWLVGVTEGPDCLHEGAVHQEEIRIGEDAFWFRERTMTDDGETLATIAGYSWHQLDRARWFACMIDFPREPGGRPVVTHHYIKIHDQGGRFTFLHPDGVQRLLTMRNTWSFGMQRNSFAIAVQFDDDNGETDVYAWAEPGADRIGMNPGHLRVQCDLDTPENVKMQHWLRPDS